MPSRYKIPAYAGNALLLALSLSMVFKNHFIFFVLLGALAALNLFLVHKLDRFSREEVWLARQLEVTKMRQELLVAQARTRELEAGHGTVTQQPGAQ